MFNASGETEKQIRLRTNVAGKSYIEVQNPAAGLRIFDVTDRDNPVQIGTSSSGTLNAVVPGTESQRTLLRLRDDYTENPARHFQKH